MSARQVVAATAVAATLILMNASPDAALTRKWFGGVVADIPTGSHVQRGPIARTANLPYGGGVVMHSNRTHVIFWQPGGSTLVYDGGYQSQVETFLARVAADSRKPTNVYGLSGQYRDSQGPAAYDSRYAGAVLATDPLPPNGCTEPTDSGPGWSVCLNDAQLDAEIQHVVTVDRLPSGKHDIYFLVMPDGMGTCETSGPDNCALGGTATGFCGYHSTTTDQQILYAVIPYNAVSGHCQSENPRPNAGTVDPTLSTFSHEHNETVTDPYGTAWIDSHGNEDGDLCIRSYGSNLGGSGAAAWNAVIHGGHYFLQEEWSNEDRSCQARDEADRVSFSAPGRVAPQAPIHFQARASDPDGSIVAYDWFFADGARAYRRAASHAVPRSGSYKAVLRTTDSAGNWTFFARTIRVIQGGKKDSAPRPHYR